MLAVTVVDSTPVVCVMERAENCLLPFQEHLEKGVSALASLDDRELVSACW